MIRFQRIGRTNDPAFRIVVVEKERAAKTGRIFEQVGTYNPHSKVMTLKADEVKMHIKNGAQVSDSLKNLLITKGVLEGKKINVLPKRRPIKKEEVAAVPAAEAPKAEEPVEEDPAAVEEAPAA